MTFGPTFNLADVDGITGFLINRTNTFDRLGTSFSGAGDVNGDGFDDFLIAAPTTNPDGRVYVVFGGADVVNSGGLNPTSLNGSNGFFINGEGRGTNFGSALSSAGDVNNDGFDDILIGAPSADFPAPFLGRSYVVFGGTNVGASGSVETRNLNGSNGFILTSSSRQRQGIGASVSDIGDINGDGIDDFIVGAPGDSPSGGGTGQTYVVFGQNGARSVGSLDLVGLNGNNGFSILGFDASDGRGGRSGSSVSSAGDVNGDGINDLIIGAPSATSDGIRSAGESYIVFGGSGIGSGGSLSLSSLNGSNGFAIQGVNRNENAGEAVSGAGDINADGFDDFVIGVPSADPNDVSNAGQSYVFFGGSSVGSSGSIKLSDINGRNGFVINGVRSFTGSGRTLSEAGDFNNDGIDDLLVGGGNDSAYVVYGDRDIGTSGTLELADLNGDNGTAFFLRGSFAGRSTSGIGDFNGDGIDDIVAGKPTDGLTSGTRAVIFGQGDRTPTAFVNDANVLIGKAFGASEQYQGSILSNTDNSGNANDFIVGTQGRDNIWTGTQGNDIVDSRGGDDIVGIGNGNSTVNVGAGNDFVYAIGQGGGNNNIQLGSGNDNFFVNAGNNTVTGSGNNLISAGTGRDVITTQGGSDFVYSTNGGGGNDVLNLGGGNNTVWVQNGNYSITTGSGGDVIGLGSGSDTVRAGDGDNFVYMVASGGGRKDVITGTGDDYIQTGAGDDLIDGGSGFNSLFGGGGRDTFVMRRSAYSFFGDFQVGADKIRLADISFDELSFFQGSNDDGSATTFIFASNAAVGQVDGTTVAALSNGANFDFG